MESDSDKLGYEVWHDVVRNIVTLVPTECLPPRHGEEGPHGVCVAYFDEKYYDEAKATYNTLSHRLKGQPLEDKILVNEIVDKTYGLKPRVSDPEIKVIMVFILCIIFIGLSIIRALWC